MGLPLYNSATGKPYYNTASGLPVYGGGDSAAGVFRYHVRRASWGYRMPDDSNYWTLWESLWEAVDRLVANYGSRSWWDSEWMKTESPSSPLGISFPAGAYDVTLSNDRVFDLLGFTPGGDVLPGTAYQIYTPGLDFDVTVGGWVFSGNSVTVSGSGYAGGLSAFGTDLEGAIVDAAGIPIPTAGTAVDVSSISSGGTFYVLPTVPIIAAFSEIVPETVFDYTDTLVDCSGLTVTAAP